MTFLNILPNTNLALSVQAWDNQSEVAGSTFELCLKKVNQFDFQFRLDK